MQTQRIEALHDEISQHLAGGIIPFWLARAWDDEFGGYRTNFDEHGEPLDTSEKYLNTQARLLWWFSTLYRHHPHLAQAHDLSGAQIDGGNDGEAHRARKLPRRRAPTSAERSGWNCMPKKLPCCTTAEKSPP